MDIESTSFWKKWGDKCERVKHECKIWGHDANISFTEYIGVIDEILREMMLTHILIEKYYHRIGATRVLLQKAFRRYCNTQWPRISNMVLQYLQPPTRPRLDARIFDSDVIQFSKAGESFINTWRRLVQEYSHLITPEIVTEVVHSIVIKDNSDIKDLDQVVYRYYQNRPTIKDGIAAIRDYDNRYNVMYYGLLIGF